MRAGRLLEVDRCFFCSGIIFPQRPQTRQLCIKDDPNLRLLAYAGWKKIDQKNPSLVRSMTGQQSLRIRYPILGQHQGLSLARDVWKRRQKAEEEEEDNE